MSREIDKVLVSIVQRRLKSVTKEMGLVLARTTRSPILCEAQDFVTGLYDAEGKMLEQTENLPILSFSLGPVCEHIISYFGDEIYPGDVIFHNDVFSWGNQNNDVAVYKPIFFDETLVGWAACKGHQADIGGAIQGGYNPRATEVWQEALRIPPIKVYEKGKLRKDVWDLIFANIRLDIVQEDMRAQIGSCVVGERGLVKLIERYGLHIFETHKRYLFDSTEKIMRAEIRSIPNGVYCGESTCYVEGMDKGATSQIRVKITVEDEDITFDYSDTDPQTPGFVNGTYTSSASATTLTFLQMINPNIPHNDGMIRPLHLIIPRGTILNAAYPAATAYGNHLCSNNADAIMRALSPVVPDRVTAEWNKLLCSLTTGIDPRSNDAYVDLGFMGLKGGAGAIAGADGYDHIGMIDASGGLLDQDYEMFEQQTPHTLVKHEYWQDSAGPGRWRGGLGVETEFIIGSDNTKVVTFGDGDVEPARGVHSGMDGTLNRIELTYPDGTRYRCTTKDLVENVPRGTVYFQQAGGGGGYGDPFLRPADKVAEEVRNGIISPESATADYGVAVDPRTFAVQDEETATLRCTRDLTKAR